MSLRGFRDFIRIVMGFVWEYFQSVYTVVQRCWLCALEKGLVAQGKVKQGIGMRGLDNIIRLFIKFGLETESTTDIKQSPNIKKQERGWRIRCVSCDSGKQYYDCCYQKDFLTGKVPLEELDYPNMPGTVSESGVRFLHFIGILVFYPVFFLGGVVIGNHLSPEIVFVTGHPFLTLILMLVSIPLCHLTTYFLIRKLSVRCPRCCGMSYFDGWTINTLTCTRCGFRHQKHFGGNF